jgi:hypothetical protein
MPGRASARVEQKQGKHLLGSSRKKISEGAVLDGRIAARAKKDAAQRAPLRVPPLPPDRPPVPDRRPKV